MTNLFDTLTVLGLNCPDVGQHCSDLGGAQQGGRRLYSGDGHVLDDLGNKEHRILVI